jgi:transcriptional regulator with XRE-family HTH domain
MMTQGLDDIKVTDEGPHPVAYRSAIAERLRLTRRVTGLGQYEFAERAGIAGNTYNQYEQGKKRPTIENALHLVNTYKLTLDWIYAGDPSNLPYSLAKAIDALQNHRGQDQPS